MLNTVTEELAHGFKEAMDEVLKRKLVGLASKALISGERELYEILSKPHNLESVSNKLQARGYTIEICYPPSPDIRQEGDTFIATVMFDNVKLKVRKLILEV